MAVTVAVVDLNVLDSLFSTSLPQGPLGEVVNCPDLDLYPEQNHIHKEHVISIDDVAKLTMEIMRNGVEIISSDTKPKYSKPSIRLYRAFLKTS